MAVAKIQIKELHQLLMSYLAHHPGADPFAAFIADAKRTVAYKCNKSFQQTVDRLLEQHVLHGRAARTGRAM